MAIEDWPELSRGYVVDCADWFDLKRYDEQAKAWDAYQWLIAAAKRENWVMGLEFFAQEGEQLSIPTPEWSDVFYHLNSDKLNEVGPWGTEFEDYHKPLVKTLTIKDILAFTYETLQSDGLIKNSVLFEIECGEILKKSFEKNLTIGEFDRCIKEAGDRLKPRVTPKAEESYKDYYDVLPRVLKSTVYPAINLDAPDREIIKSFESWLKQVRTRLGHPEPSPRPTQTGKNPRPLNSLAFTRWVDWRIIPCIDYILWRLVTGKPPLTLNEYVKILYPDFEDSRGYHPPSGGWKSDTFWKEFAWFISKDGIAWLNHAAVTWPRNHPAVLNPPKD